MTPTPIARGPGCVFPLNSSGRPRHAGRTADSFLGGTHSTPPGAAARRARAPVRLLLRRAGGETIPAEATALLETAREVRLVQSGGMIPLILRQALARSREMYPAIA